MLKSLHPTAKMYATLKTKFDEALAKKELFFTESTSTKAKVNGVDVIYTYAPALAKKPTAKENKQDQTKQSPWLPPPQDLVVETLENYHVVLNKFAVSKYHFLLVTKELEPQSALLTPRDWIAAMHVLKEANKQSGKRHVGFYNAGDASGASVPHKHLQFMTLPDGFIPFPDTTPALAIEGPSAVKHLKADKRVPFGHFITTFGDDYNGDDYAMRYSDLVGKAVTVLAREGYPISYNLAFTEEWVILTPRKAAETTDGIAINSLGTIGLLLAKSEEQLKELETRNLGIVEELGFPFEDIQNLAPDSTPGFTNY